MNSLYYSLELLIIAAVPILNSIGVKVPYWTILIVFATHFVQTSFRQSENSLNDQKLKDLSNILTKIQNNQKDILSKQKNLNDDIKLGGYN